ncbi:MAG: hypothetical protein ACSLE9_13255 [Burkholderiaceae bacterium]
MKLNQILAAALVAAASVPAMASIGLPNTGNGELFLVVWDQADAVSYVKDLGIAMDSFDSNAALNFALDDANFLGFLGVANTTVSDLKFSVIAGDSVGTKRLFSTIDNATTLFNNGSMTSGTGYINTFANNQVTVSANTTHAGPAAVNGTSYDVAPNLAYFGAQNGATLQGNTSGWTNANLVGTDAAFRSFSSVGTAGGTQTLQTTFAGVWSVSQTAGAYSATYNVAAVPEADGILMALAGFGAIAFVGRRRLS